MSEPIAVSILDREFLVACTPEERPGLIAAAAMVDGRMREIRNNARTASADRIAVMAALNIANDLLRERKEPSRARTSPIDAPETQRRIRDMNSAIDKALGEV